MLKGEAIQGCGVVLGAAHPKEFSFPVFVRVLEEGEEDPTHDPGKAYPKAFPLFLHFEEMQENIHGGKDAQVPAEDLETPYNCPAVGVELLGWSWAGAVLISVRSSLSKGVNRRHTPTRLNTVWYIKKKGFPFLGLSSKQTGSPGRPGRTDM